MLPEVKQIASRVRELREILGKSVEEVSCLIGVEVSEYKGYESGETDIPVSKIYQIAACLEVDPTVILIGDDPRMSDCTIVRGGKGIEVERYEGYNFTSLAYNFIGREMEPMIVNLKANGKKPKPVTHTGQEFNYILKGSVAVRIRNREYILNEGDSIYFNPALPHRQSAFGEKDASFLTVINEKMEEIL